LALLFVDTTYDITLGILDENLGWMKFDKFFGQKASAIIQSETYNLLESVHLKISDITSLISIAGPGFYTGLRLSEGFADVLTFAGIKHYSFLSYSIPFLSGATNGVWMTKAYRGEYFFHFWDSTSSRNELVAAKDLEEFIKSVDMSNFYIHSESSIDDYSRKFLTSYLTTNELLEKYSPKILSSVILSDSKKESFYFRAPEDEFKVSI